MQNSVYFSPLKVSGKGHHTLRQKESYLDMFFKSQLNPATPDHRDTSLCCNELSKYKGTYLLSKTEIMYNNFTIYIFTYI